jgi:hypothetical protein
MSNRSFVAVVMRQDAPKEFVDLVKQALEIPNQAKPDKESDGMMVYCHPNIKWYAELDYETGKPNLHQQIEDYVYENELPEHGSPEFLEMSRDDGSIRTIGDLNYLGWKRIIYFDSEPLIHY